MKSTVRQIASRFICAAMAFGAVLRSLPAQQTNASQVETLSRQAQHAIAAKDWPTAARELEKLAQLAPDVAEIQANLGIVYYSQNRVLDAAHAFERATRLNPKMVRASTLLGLCYAEMGRNHEAIPLLDPVFRRPSDPETGKLVGLSLERAYEGLHRYDKAMGVTDELLQRFPNDPEILFHASRFHADRAYELMVQLMKGSPDSVWVHYATAEVHASLQRFDLAIAEYQTVLKLAPQLPGVHLRLGLMLLQKSKDPETIEAAMQEFRLELGVGPQNADAEYEIGELERHRGNLESALEHFSKAVTYHRSFAEAQIGLARTLLSLGRPREAVPHLEEAVRLDPQNEVPHFLLASAYKTLGEMAKSQQEMELYQQHRASRSRPGVPVPGAFSSMAVTQQELSSDVSSKPRP